MDMMLEQFKTIFDRPEKVKKLREVILDLAVRGKLVEQDPNDEPASVLLERIKEEKDRLIKEKKIKKEKALPEISEDEKTFELPKGWCWTRLGNIGDWGAGATPARTVSEFYGGNIKWLKTGELNDGIISDSEEKITELALQKCSLRINKPGDILIAMYGATIGKLAILECSATTNQACCGCAPYKGVFNRYLFYLLLSMRKGFRQQGTGGAQPNISRQKIINAISPLPPLEEQKRIVEKVDSLMAFCDKLEEILEKKVHYSELAAKSVFNSVGNISSSEELEEMLRFIIKNFKDISLGDNAVKELKNCILQLAVQGKLVEQDPNDEPAEVLLERIREEKERLIKEKKIKKEKSLEKIVDQSSYLISRGWSLTRLGNIAKVIEYGTSTKASSEINNVPVLRMNNIINGELEYDNLKYVSSDIKDLPRLYLKRNDLLFNRTNSYELVGKTAVFKGEDDVMTFASYLIRISLFNEMIDSKYINIVMNSNLYRVTQIEPKITQQNGQANFNGTKLKSTIIPIPPLEEQKRIVKKVDSLMLLCDELEKKIEEQKEYSNKLMESAIKEMLQSISNKEEIISKEIEKEDEISVTIS